MSNIMNNILTPASKSFKCPHCGTILDAGGKEKGVVNCPSCMNDVTFDFSKQASGAPEIKNVEYTDNSVGIMIGSGNKDPESVAIFLEDYVEKHQKNIGVIFNEVGLPELSKLIQEMKLSHGADKETWRLIILYYLLPAEARIATLNSFKDEIIESIKEDKMNNAYSSFDAMNEAIKDSEAIKEELEFELTRSLDRFKKYGGDSSRYKEFDSRIKAVLREYNALEVLDDINDIKEASKAIKDREKKVIEKLRKEGIDAENTYISAKHYEDMGQLTDAVYNYSLLGDFRDSAKKVKVYNKSYIVGSLLESEGLYVGGGAHYYTRDHISDIELAQNKRELRKAVRQENKEAKTDEDSRRFVRGADLIHIENNEPVKTPDVSDYRKYLLTFGNLFYYISRKGTIHAYDLIQRVDKELEKNAKHLENQFFITYDNETKGLLLSDSKAPINDPQQAQKDAAKRAKQGDFEPQWANKYRVDILHFGFQDSDFKELLIDGINEVEKFARGQMISDDYIAVTRGTYEKRRNLLGINKVFETKHRVLVNLKTREVFDDVIGVNDSYVKVVGNDVFYTSYNPTCYNLKLMKKDIITGKEEMVIDNVYNVVDIVDSKVFYVIGNSRKQSLFNLDLGSGETYKIFEDYNRYNFYRDGYFYLFSDVYYSGKKKYATLYKISEHGDERIVLASGLLLNSKNQVSFGRIMNGYYYYIHYNSKLVRVRLDGTNRQVIAENMNNVLKIDNQYIYYSTEETVDMMYRMESIKSGEKYLLGFSIYRYDIKKQISQKVMFNIFDYHYDYDTEEFYIIRRSEEVFHSLNMKKGKNFDYRTDVESYYKVDLDNQEEQLIMQVGLPHQNKPKGCFLFRKRRGAEIDFEQKPWIRPYLKEKEREL